MTLAVRERCRPRHHVDVHTPANDKGGASRQLPAIVFVHGGAWSWGHKFHYTTLCQTLASAVGAVVVNVNYSVYPNGNVDDMVKDVQRAVRWASHKCQRLPASCHAYDAALRRLPSGGVDVPQCDGLRRRP